MRGKKGVFTEKEVIQYRKQYESMRATGAKTALFKRQIARQHGLKVQSVYAMLTGFSYKWVES